MRRRTTRPRLHKTTCETAATTGAPADGRRDRTVLACVVAVTAALVSGTGGILSTSAAALHGDITTVAGTGTEGYSGDGGPATSARMAWPIDVAVDSDGDLYIADTFNHRVRKVGPDGTITTVAGTGATGPWGDGGPATSAQLSYPFAVAVDATGNLYIADTSGHRIRKVDLLGTITTVAGTGSGGYSGDGGPATGAQLQNPRGVAVDALGNLYVADVDNHRVRKVDPLGTITTVAGTGSSGYS